MSLDRRSPPEYLIGHIEDALARDPRVNEQGVRAALARDAASGLPTVVVTGTVTSAAHKRNIATVIGELLPDHPVEDRTALADYAEVGEVEELP